MVIVFLIKKMVYFWIETTNGIQMKKNFSISEIDQNIAVVEDSQSNGSTFLDDFVYGGGSEFMLPINNTSSTGFPTFFDDSVVQQQSACTVYQNQSDAEWMGDYQMCDGTWQYGGYLGAGASVCLVSGTAFTLSGMDLVPLYPCGDSEPPMYEKPFPQPPSYGEPQTIEMPIYPPNDEVEQPYFPQPPSYGEPQTIEMPVEKPQATPETTFVDDSIFPIITEMPQQMEKMPMEESSTTAVSPIDQFVSGTLQSTPATPAAVTPAAVTPAAVTPAAVTPAAVTNTPLPTKPVSKNLTPYIYAGLGIIVILVVARMVTKK